MNSIAQTAALIALGGIVGVGGFALVTAEAPAEAATPIREVAVAVAPPAEPTANAEKEPTDVLTVEYGTTGAIESGAPTRAFAVFAVRASQDVADVELVVTGAPGTEVEEAVGYEFTQSSGSLTISIGELAATAEREVVVAFSLPGESGKFTTHTSYTDLHTGTLQNATGASTAHTITRSLRRAEIYETVRTAYSVEAIEMARKFRDQQRYDDALAWIDDAYATNLEVGYTMRLTGDLSGYQSTLSNLRDEIEILSRPKPKRRVKKQEKKIELICGDNKTCRELKRNDIYIN